LKNRDLQAVHFFEEEVGKRCQQTKDQVQREADREKEVQEQDVA